MFKKLLLLLLSMNLFASDNDKPKDSSTSTTMIVIYCVGGAVVVAGEAFIVAAPYAQVVSFSITGGRIVRPYIIQTIDEKLAEFLKAEVAELTKAKTELSKCLVKHKKDSQRDNSGCPTACEDIAFTFAILAGQDEFDKIMKSFQKD